MKLSIRQQLFLIASFILFCNGIIGYAFYYSNQKLHDSANLVQHTEQVIIQSNQILLLAKDIETGARGFVITNDSSFLEPYTVGHQLISTNLGQLKYLTKDNPLQQARVDSLKNYLQKRFDVSTRMIELRSQKGMAVASEYVLTKTGKESSDGIQHLIIAIQDEENSLLLQRKQTNEKSAAMFNKFSMIMFVCMTGFTILLIVFIGIYLIQSKEKEKRAAELIIANQELVFQNQEKEKRAAELIIANRELIVQSQEKEKRAAELIIANRELVFQYNEKEKRAAELVIANKELVFQNQEKEKRAAELGLANKELAFQSEEKEKRAAELIGINQELKHAEASIRKLNEELEQKVIQRTAQLELVNKELESFSYSVSHDLRTPLRAVHGYAKMLKEDFGTHLDAEANRVINNILINSVKMGQLIDDLLTFSRLGRKDIVKLEIPMHNMVQNICSEFKSDQKSRNFQFKLKELQAAQGDCVTIKQVWINLISNAVKYTKLLDKTIISIESEILGNEIIYTITDNGIGFDMRYSDKLFGVFQRLHSDENFEGTGVGLAIVHRIVTKHGGRVWAEGKVNEGAKFHFSLPHLN